METVTPAKLVMTNVGLDLTDRTNDTGPAFSTHLNTEVDQGASVNEINTDWRAQKSMRSLSEYRRCILF